MVQLSWKGITNDELSKCMSRKALSCASQVIQGRNGYVVEDKVLIWAGSVLQQSPFNSMQ